jgi:hypothetical protein
MRSSWHWLTYVGAAMLALGLAAVLFSQTGPSEFPSPPENVDLDSYRITLEEAKQASLLRIKAGLVGYYLVILGGFAWLGGLVLSQSTPDLEQE